MPNDDREKEEKESSSNRKPSPAAAKKRRRRDSSSKSESQRHHRDGGDDERGGGSPAAGGEKKKRVKRGRPPGSSSRSVAVTSSSGEAANSSSGDTGKIPMPKRPLSGYNYFFKDQRPKILAEQQEAPAARGEAAAAVTNSRQEGSLFRTLNSEVSKRWKSLSAEERKPYADQSKADSLRYRREMEGKTYNCVFRSIVVTGRSFLLDFCELTLGTD